MTEAVDWTSVFMPDLSPLELIVRGSVMYLSLFILLRVILKRQSGTLGMTDLLLIVLLADASQNAMSSQYRSLPDGVVLVATLIFWNYSLDWLSYHFPLLRRLIEPPPLPLIKDGTLLRKNMRQELITEEELMGQIREQGVDDLSQVKNAFMERDGRISVIEKAQKHHTKSNKNIS